MGRSIDTSAWPRPGGAPAESKKGPAIGDGSQSREEPQYKSICSNVVCRNSHTHRKFLRAAVCTVKGADRSPRQYPLNLYRRPSTYL